MNRSSSFASFNIFQKIGLRRGAFFGSLIMLALLAFEIFNYSTTDYALKDLLGSELKFVGIRWATILSIAFCGIDFAGIARIFTPEQEAAKEPAEVWYLFGAWVLAAAMNATLTWWGVAIAINGHTPLGASIINREVITQVVPIFVAVMVWLIRLLIIGTFSMAGDRLFSMADVRRATQPTSNHYQNGSASINNLQRAPGRIQPTVTSRTEPNYQPVGMTAKSNRNGTETWK